MDDEIVEDMLAVYKANGGGHVSLAVFANQPEVDDLCRFDLATLRTAAGDASRAAGGLTLQSWLHRCREIERASTHLGLAATAQRAHVSAMELVMSRMNGTRGDGVAGLAPDIARQAFARLRERAAGGDWQGDRLRRRAARWRTPPSRSLVGAPVISADSVEIAIVAILSATYGNWQFSSTPAGDVFTHQRRGYSREAEREYVAGLSDVLDATADLIGAHRGGLGGRVYVSPHLVECAECQRVMAWINEPGSGRSTVFGRCDAG